MNRNIDELNAWLDSKRPTAKPGTWIDVLLSGLLGLAGGLWIGWCAIYSGAL